MTVKTPFATINFTAEYQGRTAANRPTMVDMDEWKCIIKYQGRQYTFPFFQGTGHNGKKPKLWNALECLFMDASAFECATSALDFAHEFGYKTDTAEQRRHVEKTYNQCGRINEALHRLFGDDFEAIEDYCRELNG